VGAAREDEPLTVTSPLPFDEMMHSIRTLACRPAGAACLLAAVVTAAIAFGALAARTVLAQSPAAGPPDILISRQLAESEKLGVGTVVRLAPRGDGTGARDYRVAGIYEPTPNPNRLGQVAREARLHLPDLLNLTGTATTPGHVDTVNVTLRNPADARAFARDVMSRIPGVTAQPAGDAAGAAGPFRVLERFHLAIAVVTILAATVFLLALTVMLVDERRETVGVLRLMGLPAHRILFQVLIEGVLVAGLGALLGLVVAAGSEVFINRFFQWRYDTALVFVRVTPEVAARCVAIAVPLGVTATVVASWALLRRNALRLARR
jgi:putative ABC transport system permease protein